MKDTFASSVIKCQHCDKAKDSITTHRFFDRVTVLLCLSCANELDQILLMDSTVQRLYTVMATISRFENGNSVFESIDELNRMRFELELKIVTQVIGKFTPHETAT